MVIPELAEPAVEVHAAKKLLNAANTPIPLFFKFIFEEVNISGLKRFAFLPESLRKLRELTFWTLRSKVYK